MKLNTPNMLTLLRVVLIPLCLGIMLEESFPYRLYVALGVFLVAAFTDFLDGYYARKHNQVTTFGKFLDPLADKLLILGVLMVMIEMGTVSAAPVVVILARELAVTSIRLAAIEKGEVVAANKWGKRKMIVQIIAVSGLFVLQQLIWDGILPNNDLMFLCREVVLWIAALVSVLSGIQYYVANKGVLGFGEEQRMTFK